MDPYWGPYSKSKTHGGADVIRWNIVSLGWAVCIGLEFCPYK